MVRDSVEKPFPEFKWRWAVLTPTESLNEPHIFFGVLRVMHQAAGQPASSDVVLELLRQAESDLSDYLPPELHLARSSERNLLRNSQQYWKALGVLGNTAGGIHLTPFGADLAAGALTREEFAAVTVKNLTLPNRAIESSESAARWDTAGLSIRPLELLLRTILELHATESSQAYLTATEVQRVVVPLSGVQAPIAEHASHILEFREDPSRFSHFPDCAPASNDRRMVREFLLFLSHHGYLSRSSEGPERFSLHPEDAEPLRRLLDFTPSDASPTATADEIVQRGDVGPAVRRRVLAHILTRPVQARFRRDVLTAAGGRCLITGETLQEVLQACHIIPVPEGGPDHVSNGLCLRSDIHLLFDSGHVRVAVDGAVAASRAVASSHSYSSLPSNVVIPPYVNPQNLRWRWRYEG